MDLMDEKHPEIHVLLMSSAEHHGDSNVRPIKFKTGTIWTAMAHVITAMIGAGVLSLAWSIAQLGWVAGPVFLLMFAAVSVVATFLLCDCYRSPDPEVGRTVNASYLAAVKYYLGPRNELICGVVLNESLFGSCVAYTITAALCMRGIQQSRCHQREGEQASCIASDKTYMLLFGCVQVILSQIPDFNNMKWLSMLATLMSLAYSTILLGLGLFKIIENGEIKGSIRGVSSSSNFYKWSSMFQALGDVAFAFPFSAIVLEIQDTLKRSPYENKTMKKASLSGISISTFFFLFCGCLGYAAFGDDTPGNILSGFGSIEASWIIDITNAFIVVHVIGSYQLGSQPIFAYMEGSLAVKLSNFKFVKDIYLVKLPLLPTIRLNLIRLCSRSIFVASTTGTAILFPYFNQVLGVLGALNFWPLVIYFPVEMYLVQRNINGWKITGILLRSFSVNCLLVCIIALAGSIEALVRARMEITS